MAIGNEKEPNCEPDADTEGFSDFIHIPTALWDAIVPKDPFSFSLGWDAAIGLGVRELLLYLGCGGSWQKLQGMWTKIILTVATLAVAGGGNVLLAAEDVIGRVEWPFKWVVFAPIDDAKRTPDGVSGEKLPEAVTLANGTELRGVTVDSVPGRRLDLKELFPESKVGNVAWLYAIVNSPEEQVATIGAGADWWFTLWLNGEEVLAASEGGNGAWPPTANDHVTDVLLRKGDNLLVIRYITGNASAMIASGGPAEILAERARIGSESDPDRFNREGPYMERAPFDPGVQAIATAEMTFELPDAGVDLASGALAGLMPMPKRQLELQETNGRLSVGDTEYRRFPYDPVKILLSKVRYPFEDDHIEAVVWTSPPEGIGQTGNLVVNLKDGKGTVLSSNRIDSVSDTGWFFAVGIPPALAGSQGSLEVIWYQEGKEVSRAEESFEVLPPAGVARSGSIPVQVINGTHATIANAPMTVGVPFPHGALRSADNVRLVDEHGREVPMQVCVTARWSRFGPIKWLLCDFTASLDGGPRQFALEYGPSIKRSQKPLLTVDGGDGDFPALDTGRLQIRDGAISFDANGDGRFAPVLGEGALIGEYVRHEDGLLFRVPADVRHVVEEIGSEKAVIRRTGWYRDPESGDRFCNFVTRLVFHRDSPVVRIYHTWIFTGDSNRDRIRDMGWRFETPANVVPEGFLLNFASDQWQQGEYLVQFDYDQYLIDNSENRHRGRTPGVVSARVGDSRVLLGAKDFWQSFPSELSFADGAITFHNWPRHNIPAFSESPTPAGHAFRLRFAHEGELLDFRAPPEYFDGQIYDIATNGGRESPWERGNQDSVNGQGVARTEEIILYFTRADADLLAAVPVMQGFNDETLRAIVDPVWMAESGAFGRIHPRDTENFPKQEALYDLIARAPALWNERLGAYGMWVHGDFPVDGPDLREQTASPRRTWKRGHHGWPYKWMPFVRSGDPELFKLAEAGSRRRIDSGFCHYVDPEFPDPFRAQGWSSTSLFPWSGGSTRGISEDVDHMWQNYYLTGFQRPRDVALLWGEVIKRNFQRGLQGRISVAQFYYYLDQYRATFDPWFLAAAHELATFHREIWSGEIPDYYTTDTIGHFWKPGDYNFYLFTGDERQWNTALRMAMTWTSPWAYTKAWQRLDVPFLEQAAAAWHMSGDDYYLGRIAGDMDSAAIQVFDGPEPEYLRGSNVRHGGSGTALELFTGWYIQHFPYGLHALASAGGNVEPIPEPFFQRPTDYEKVTVDGVAYARVRQPDVLILHRGTAGFPIFFDTWDYRHKIPYNYTVTPVGGESLLSGQWIAEEIDRVDFPAGAPEGVYRLELEGLTKLGGDPGLYNQFAPGLVRVPATPHNVPEVMVFQTSPDGTRIGPSVYEAQYWFLVPEGVESFWVQSVGSGKVWDPDGNVVWSKWDATAEGDKSGRAAIAVDPAHRGKLWRVTCAGACPGFTIDPVIPPFFSVSRAKWFDPRESGVFQ